MDNERSLHYRMSSCDFSAMVQQHVIKNKKIILDSDFSYDEISLDNYSLCKIGE